MPLVDASPGRGGYLRGIAERYATAAGPAGALLGRIVAADAGGTTLELHGLDPLAGATTIRLATAGRHNAANALAVAGAALSLGVAPERIAAGIATFGGVGRRLERKGEAAGVVVYDDYGHHPTAIRATLAAVRQREPGRRVWAVYEPLTYHRTAAMLGAVRRGAGRAPTRSPWRTSGPAGTRDTTIASAADLAAAIQIGPARASRSSPRARSRPPRMRWPRTVRPGDAVLVMGGGASYRIGERLLERLEVSG